MVYVLRAVCAFSRRRLFGTGVGVQCLTLEASRFDKIFQRCSEATATTANAFRGAPLSALSPCVRGHVLAGLARLVDMDTYPHSEFECARPGNCVNGSKRGLGREEYDWLRDGLRVECKSAMMVWHSSQKIWTFRFYGVKVASEGVRNESAFDELLLVLYTPMHLYFYRHDGKLGLTRAGCRTISSGHQIQITGGRNVEQWPMALNNVLGKLDSSANTCSHLLTMSIEDPRIQSIFDLRHDVTPGIYDGIPLSNISPCARGRTLEQLVRCVDGIANPSAEIASPDPGQCFGGSRRRSAQQSCFDWRRGATRVECKSSQLRWDKRWTRWTFNFSNIKIKNDSWFDELLLALYTPRGIYVYRHDMRFQMSSRGVDTREGGHQVHIHGPSHEADWTVALDVMLLKLDTSGCSRMAFVQW